jgi:hypothetical protein
VKNQDKHYRQPLTNDLIEHETHYHGSLTPARSHQSLIALQRPQQTKSIQNLVTGYTRFTFNKHPHALPSPHNINHNIPIKHTEPNLKTHLQTPTTKHIRGPPLQPKRNTSLNQPDTPPDTHKTYTTRARPYPSGPQSLAVDNWLCLARATKNMGKDQDTGQTVLIGAIQS